MPAYLCHGFRWHRQSIRVFVVVQDLDDAAPEWIIGRRSASALLVSFYNIFDFLPSLENRPTTPRRPSHQQSSSLSKTLTSASSTTTATATTTPTPAAADDDEVMGQKAWSAVRLLEEYDPTRLDEVSRPYAYVADYVVRIDLSVSIVDEMTRYDERLRASAASSAGKGPAAGELPPAMLGPHSDEAGRKRPAKEQRKAGWLEKLRDQLQRGEDIRWYVVVNGDEERPWEYEANGGRGRAGDDHADGEVAGQEEGGLEAEYNRALEERKRQQEQEERLQQQRQLHEQKRLQQQQQQRQQRQQPPQPRFNGDGAGRSVDELHRERERQRLRQELGGLDIDSDPEDPPPAAAAVLAPAQRLGSRSRGNSNKGVAPPPPLEPLPPEYQQLRHMHSSTSKMSMDGYPRPPKTPKSGGFRRLFGMGHSHKGSTAESP